MSIKNKWQIRSVLAAGKSALPFKSMLRSLNRRAGGGRHWPEEGRVYVGPFQHLELLQKAGLRLRGRQVLEIGTGSEPILLLVMRLAGAKRVYLTDVEPLLDKGTLLAAVDFLLGRKHDVAERLGVSTRYVERRLAVDRAGSLPELLAALELDYVVPFEPGEYDIEVACIVSHRTLEHIPAGRLARILADCHSILEDDGVMSHGVDHSDHRVRHDKSLSRIDFLKYNDTVWNLLSLGAYTNRLRHRDYAEMLEASGYEICSERRLVDPQCVADAKRLALKGRFEAMDREDLATLWSFIVARPRGRARRGAGLPQRPPSERATALTAGRPARPHLGAKRAG